MSLVASLGTGAGTALIWGALLYLVATGRIGLASAGTAVFALRTASSGLQGMVGNGARLYRMGLYLDDLFGFLDEAGGHRIARGSVVPGAPEVLEVKGLTYIYPGEQQQPALQDVQMTLRRGEVVALIGQNGSGKSTLLKLLAGLYRPAVGSITWDGVPVADLDAEGLWRRVARVPQEYANWPLPAAENVHLGNGLDDPDLMDAVRRAAARTGFDEIVDRLRSGWGTLLAQGWWEGPSCPAEAGSAPPSPGRSTGPRATRAC